MTPMSPVMSRFAALGLLSVCVLAVFMFGILPLVEGYKVRDNASVRLSNRLAMLTKLVANELTVNSALQDQYFSPANKNIFLTGSNTAIASANLREFLSNIIEQSGGRLVSTQQYDAPSTETVRALGLRFQFNGETDHLFRLLHLLETARPLVFIDKMTISSSAGKSSAQRAQLRRQRARRSTRSIRSSLTVKMDIYGYTLANKA